MMGPYPTLTAMLVDVLLDDLVDNDIISDPLAPIYPPPAGG